MQWNELKDLEQLKELRIQSFSQPQVIFKHSTRCAISSMAKSRLEREPPPSGFQFHFLDLIKYRTVSNAIASDFDIWHESPQLIVIRNGKCVYDESHSGISMTELAANF